MNNIEFKIATISDIEKIIALCNECFEEETPIEYAKKIFEETMNDPNQIYLLGTINGEAVAHVKITIIPTIYQPMATYAIINHVCVKPSHRRHNLATIMLDKVFKICKEKNCQKVELWSNNVRKAAHACYKNYGFIVEDAKFFSKKVEEIEML